MKIKLYSQKGITNDKNLLSNMVSLDLFYFNLQTIQRTTFPVGFLTVFSILA